MEYHLRPRACTERQVRHEISRRISRVGSAVSHYGIGVCVCVVQVQVATSSG